MTASVWGAPAEAAAPANHLDLLAQLRDRLEADVDDLVEHLYAGLVAADGPAEVLALLRPHEVAQLKARQAEHLVAMFDPDVGIEEAAARAREVGRVHALVGVDVEWYVAALADHHQQIVELVGTLPDDGRRGWLYSATARRLMQDLQTAMVGYREVEASQHRALALVQEAVAAAGTVPDLVSGVLGACTDLDGLTAGFFGRPDRSGVFQFEMAFGEGAEEFMTEVTREDPLTITVLGDEASGRGPAGRAWRSGRIQRTDSYLTDPTTEPWHGIGQRLGWRSGVWVPLMDGNGAPRALLAFYSPWPGFFRPPARQAMSRQVRALVERSLDSLEARGAVASGVRTYSARSSYLAKLHEGALEMVYQPIVELATGRVTKMEALARLEDQERLVLPGEFLP
ncbi:MAG: protoglobin domain-containing protein, partial [Nocardioidaceae bacterium]